MSGLEEAIDRIVLNRPSGYWSDDIALVLEAARKYANLTCETRYEPRGRRIVLEERWVSDWTPAGIDSEDTPAQVFYDTGEKPL